MNKLLSIFILTLSLAKVEAQTNLVPNYSFEQFNACPDNVSQIDSAKYWFNANTGTSDYYNACANGVGVPNNEFGYQNAKTGVAYAGILANDYEVPTPSYREYIEIKLSDSLQAGIKYFASFYLSLADSSHFATDDLGMYFSNDSLISDTFTNFSVIPQVENIQENIIADKINWVLLSGEFTATGGEWFLTIGNFKNDSEITLLYVGGDTIAFDKRSAYYYIDDVCVSTDSSLCITGTGIKQRVSVENSIQIYPNPITDNSVLVIPSALRNEDVRIRIYDLFGREVKQMDIPKGVKSVSFNKEGLSSGIYFMSIQQDNKVYSQKLIIKN